MDELPLRRDTLADPRALAALGLLVAKALREGGIASLFINADGDVEVILPGELECDGLEELSAIKQLLDRGYEDAQVITYLKGRDTRTKNRSV